MSPLKKIYLIVIGTILTIVLFIFFLVLPMINKIEGLSKEYTDGKITLSQIQQKELLLDKQKQFLQEVKEDLSKIEKSFLKEKNLVKSIASLEKVAKDNKIQLEIEALSLNEEDQPPYFSLSVLIKGSFTNLLRFLFALENTPGPSYRLIEIKSASIKSIKTDEDEEPKVKTTELEGNLEARIYTEPNSPGN